MVSTLIYSKTLKTKNVMYIIFYKTNNSARLMGTAKTITEAEQFIEEILDKPRVILRALDLDVTDYDVWVWSEKEESVNAIWVDQNTNDRTIENEDKGYPLFSH
jgi:uncharacterized membrane-anchored protein